MNVNRVARPAEHRRSLAAASGGLIGAEAAERHGQSGRGEGRGRGQRQLLRSVSQRGSGPVHRRQEEESGQENPDHRDGE